MKLSDLNLKKVKNKRLLLIDGNNLVHRCYWGAKQAEDQKQVTTLLALNQILNFKNLCMNSIMVFFWDSKYSYRAKLYDFYKQHKLDDADPQKEEIINHIKNIFVEMGFQSFEQYGYEGDDLIALYADVYSKQNKVIIFSTDEDLFQCLNSKIIHYNPLKNETNTCTTIKKNMGLNPKDIAIRKAMVGKKNEVPGIPKIGEKTALKIINGDVDFPEFDQYLFREYLDVSILPFQYNEDPLIVKEIEKFESTKNNFKRIFQENDFNNFLTTRSINIWSKHFNLK